MVCSKNYKRAERILTQIKLVHFAGDVAWRWCAAEHARAELQRSVQSIRRRVRPDARQLPENGAGQPFCVDRGVLRSLVS